MDHSAAPPPYPYAQPGAYPPYPYPYPTASAAWPPGFDPAMLPYPDPRMYAGGVPGYFDHLAGRPPPSAAEFYAAAAVSPCVYLLSPSQRPLAVYCPCQPVQTFANLALAQNEARPGRSPLGQDRCVRPAAPHKQSAYIHHHVSAVCCSGLCVC